MAAKGDSKQGLVITLVFFVLLSVLLGVVAYFGFSEQEQLANDKKKALDEKKTAEQVRDFYRWQARMLWAYSGEMPPKYNEELDDLMNRLAPVQDRTRKLKTDIKSSDRDDVAALADKLVSDKWGWDEAKKKPSKTYKGELDKQAARITELEGLLKNEQNKFAKVNADLTAKLKELKEEQDNFKANLAKQSASGVEDLKKYVERNKELTEELKSMGERREELQNTIGQLEQKHQDDTKRFQKDIDLLNLRVAKAQEKVPQPDFLELDQPKGKILQIDRSGQLPFIDIGRADNVKTGLTFSVYGVDLTGKPAKEPKASLEVMEVLGERLSQARITALRDPNRDPVTRGDLLFNPAWSPTLKQHVAIAGIVDLTGDAHRDNTNQLMRSLLEFKRTLENQGMVVDAYLDLKENAVKGAITRQTDYLVLGDTPDLDAAGPIKVDNPRAQRKEGAAALIGDMQKEAIANGVTIISLRKFLTLTGYRLPRPIRSEAPDFSFRPAGAAAPTPIDRRPPAGLPAGNDDKKNK